MNKPSTGGNSAEPAHAADEAALAAVREDWRGCRWAAYRDRRLHRPRHPAGPLFLGSQPGGCCGAGALRRARPRLLPPQASRPGQKSALVHSRRYAARPGERSHSPTTLANALTSLDTMARRRSESTSDRPAAGRRPPAGQGAARDKTPVWLGYATNKYNSYDIEVWQQEFMDAFISGSTTPMCARRRSASRRTMTTSCATGPLLPRPAAFMPVAMSGRQRAATIRAAFSTAR